MKLPSEFENLNTPSMKMRRASKAMRKYIDIALVFITLVLTYFVSDKLGEFLQTMNLELLQRIINMVLVVIVIKITSKKQ